MSLIFLSLSYLIIPILSYIVSLELDLFRVTFWRYTAAKFFLISAIKLAENLNKTLTTFMLYNL